MTLMARMLYLSLDYLKNAQVRVGQIRVPLSLEGLQSSSALDTVERALFLSDGARAAADWVTSGI